GGAPVDGRRRNEPGRREVDQRRWRAGRRVAGVRHRTGVVARWQASVLSRRPAVRRRGVHVGAGLSHSLTHAVVRRCVSLLGGTARELRRLSRRLGVSYVASDGRAQTARRAQLAHGASAGGERRGTKIEPRFWRMTMIDLDGCTMFVGSTAAMGVVGAETRL